MNHFKCIQFMNPNKQRPVELIAGMIVGFDYNAPTACNVIYSAGGHVFPVAESLEEIRAKIESLNSPTDGQGEKKNESAKAVRRSAVNLRKSKTGEGRPG